MDTPPPSLAPLTPLGARTHLAHPGLYAVIAALSLIIVVGAAWVVLRFDVIPDTPEPVPSPSPSSSMPATGASYENSTYGLRVNLPDEWTGFTVSEEPDTYANPPGILLVFTHPKSTAQTPYEQLPILIYPVSEWPCISDENGTCYQGVAPFPPGELARNSRYVFALPPRYNYDFSAGFQALDDAIRAGAVSAFEPVAGTTPKPSSTRFSSQHFTLSFTVPDGYAVYDSENYIAVSRGQYQPYEIGDDNAFLSISRFTASWPKEKAIADMKAGLTDITEGSITIDGVSFPTIEGVDAGRYEGTSAGRVLIIVFDKSLLYAIQSPRTTEFNGLTVARDIIASMRFSR